MPGIMTKPFGFASIIQWDNQYFLGPMHSFIKVEILEQKIVEDTIEIKYQAGSSKKIKSKTEINLTNKIKFLKCQNVHNHKKTFQLYEVLRNEEKYKIVFLRDME
jgi:hypothetical protein